MGSGKRGPPVFVFGNQKSGTTAVAALLARYLGLEYSHDMFFQNGWIDNDAAFRNSLEISELVKRSPRSFSAGVIKDPDLTFMMTQCLRHFSDSQSIFLIREPRRNIASILHRLGLEGNHPSASVPPMRFEQSILWGNTLSSERLGLPPGNYVETLARRWRRAAELYRYHASETILLRYEDFTKNKYRSISRIAEELKREQVNSIDKMLDFKFQPNSKNIENFDEFFGDENSQRIKSICGDLSKYFGYM